jgi:putative solute:sodium symporter small subunit
MSDPKNMSREQRAEAYWRENQRLISILLIIWFAVSYVPILLVNVLNNIVIAGFPLGYYMGSQGSLIAFVVMIFYYAFAMRRLDEKYGMNIK